MRKKYEGRMTKLLAGAMAAVGAMAAPTVAAAQGCAMCYTSASAAKQSALESLQNGIMILLLPPLLMFAGILWLAFRPRAESEDSEPCEEPARFERLRRGAWPESRKAEMDLHESARFE